MQGVAADRCDRSRSLLARPVLICTANGPGPRTRCRRQAVDGPSPSGSPPEFGVHSPVVVARPEGHPSSSTSDDRGSTVRSPGREGGWVPTGWPACRVTSPARPGPRGGHRSSGTPSTGRWLHPCPGVHPIRRDHRPVRTHNAPAPPRSENAGRADPPLGRGTRSDGGPGHPHLPRRRGRRLRRPATRGGGMLHRPGGAGSRLRLTATRLELGDQEPRSPALSHGHLFAARIEDA